MDVPDKDALARMPLAEAVLSLFSLVTSKAQLDKVWDENRGRCYENIITFELMVQLIFDALIKKDGSGRRAFREHIKSESLQTSIEAAYGKLRRLPLQVSEAFLQESTSLLKECFPEWAAYQTPESLQAFEVVKLDGKALKRVARRLKSTRGTSGGLLGGRALVALHWSTGLALAMHTHEDGEANDVKFVGDLVPVVRANSPQPILWVGDRAFCDLTQPHHFRARQGDHFLVRYHSKTKFYPEETRSPRTAVTSDGQTFTQSWGWLGAASNKRRLYVRRIEILRKDDTSIILITDLLDADTYLAEDLIWMYRQRWDIEQVFQKVTEVFHLETLIGSTARASVFQFSFCLLLHNLMQVVKGCIAEGADLEPDEISVDLLMKDVETQLKCWDLMIDREITLSYFQRDMTPRQLRRGLARILKNVWTELWRKSSSSGRQYKPPAKRKKAHGSVYRIERDFRQRQRNQKKTKNTPKAKNGRCSQR